MNIDDFGNRPARRVEFDFVRVQRARRVDSHTTPPLQWPPTPDSFAPGHQSQVEQLLYRMRSEPEVREELMSEVRQRMTIGYYHSREISELTAGAMLGVTGDQG